MTLLHKLSPNRRASESSASTSAFGFSRGRARLRLLVRTSAPSLDVWAALSSITFVSSAAKGASGDSCWCWHWVSEFLAHFWWLQAKQRGSHLVSPLASPLVQFLPVPTLYPSRSCFSRHHTTDRGCGFPFRWLEFAPANKNSGCLYQPRTPFRTTILADLHTYLLP